MFSFVRVARLQIVINALSCQINNVSGFKRQLSVQFLGSDAHLRVLCWAHGLGVTLSSVLCVFWGVCVASTFSADVCSRRSRVLPVCFLVICSFVPPALHHYSPHFLPSVFSVCYCCGLCWSCLAVFVFCGSSVLLGCPYETIAININKTYAYFETKCLYFLIYEKQQFLMYYSIYCILTMHIFSNIWHRIIYYILRMPFIYFH